MTGDHTAASPWTALTIVSDGVMGARFDTRSRHASAHVPSSKTVHQSARRYAQLRCACAIIATALISNSTDTATLLPASCLQLIFCVSEGSMVATAELIKSGIVEYGSDLAGLPARLRRRAFKRETYEEMRISADIASHNGMKRVSLAAVSRPPAMLLRLDFRFSLEARFYLALTSWRADLRPKLTWVCLPADAGLGDAYTAVHRSCKCLCLLALASTIAPPQ